MQLYGHPSRFDRHPSAPTPLLGSSGRLTLAAAVLGEALSLASTSRARGPAPGNGAAFLEAAVVAYEDGRWADAFDAAAGRADAGDPGAAKLALLMLRHGVRLYGTGFSAEPLRIARWAKTVLQARSEASRRVACDAAPQRGPRSTSRRTASPSSITAIA